MRRSRLKGKIWVLLDNKGRLIENIDTDQIYHNSYLPITELSLMGQYALGNLEGWKDFASSAHAGDILVAGRNFGAGSSRQQAVDCFVSLKIRAILASSFGAIYYRNAVNSGFPVLRSSELEELAATNRLETGDLIEFNLSDGLGKNISKVLSFRLEPMSPVQYEIYRAGNLFNYGKNIK